MRCKGKIIVIESDIRKIEREKMKCFKCGAEAPAGNQFCPKCGASMSVGQLTGSMGQAQGNPVSGNQNAQVQNQAYSNLGYQNPGYLNAGYQNPGYPVPGQTANSLATASMVLGIIADATVVMALIVGSFAEKKILGYGTGYVDENVLGISQLLIFVAFCCGFIGFILSICGLAKKTMKKGRAIAGFVCNGLLIIPVLLAIIFVIIGVGSGM